MYELLEFKDATHARCTEHSNLYVLREALDVSDLKPEHMDIPESLFDLKWMLLSEHNFEQGHCVTIECPPDIIETGFQAVIYGFHEGVELSAKFFFSHDWSTPSMKPFKVLTHLWSLTNDQCKSFIDDHNNLKVNKTKKKKNSSV